MIKAKKSANVLHSAFIHIYSVDTDKEKNFNWCNIIMIWHGGVNGGVSGV